MMTNRIGRFSLLTALIAALTLMACGDAKLTSDGIEPEFEDEQPGRPGPSVPTEGSGEPPTVVEEEPYIPPDDELGCVLIPSVGGDVFVGVESAVQIGVYQYSLDSGEVMEGEQIEFAFVEGSVPGRLSASRVRTNEEGLAAVRVDADIDPGVMVVRAIAPCARSIDIEIEVLELPTGNLQVSMNYPFRDTYDLDDIHLDLFLADDIGCRDVDRGERPTDPFKTETVSDVTGSATYNGLGIESAYTVVAVGIGEFGERAAWGCLDNVMVRDGRTTEVTVDLFLLPLNPAGDYDVLSNWDFRDAIAESGEVGRIIVDVLDVFEDPGAGIVNFLLDLVEDFVGGLISGAIDLFLSLTGLDDVIADAINSVIESSPFLSDIVTIGRDLRSIIAELEVISELSIGKLGSDYEVFGVDNWIGLSLYWRLDCDETSPPDCGRIPIVLDSVDLGLLRGEWNGRVIGYNRLDILEHPIDFNYGRLILYVLEYLVLPAITGDPGPVTLEDLMSSIIGCASIGDFIAGGDGDCLCALGACVCDDDIEGFCDSFISFTFGPIFRGFVESLSFDAVLNIRGSVTMVNNNEELGVDALEDGEYIGSIIIDGSPTAFDSSFCGVRQGGPVEVTDFCLGGDE